jgi:hypothetical protein
MDNLLQMIFPEGEERWIKVLYVDPKEAMKHLRLNVNGRFNNNLGFEVTALGATSEYVPQIEALAQLKNTLERDPMLYPHSDIRDRVAVHIDQAIFDLLKKVQLTSK